MKTLPKLWKLLSITILLIGISWNACFGETPARGPSMILTPTRHKCLDLLELERLKINPQTNTITFDDQNLAADYHNVVGWLRGFFSGWNFNPGTDGDVTKQATTYQMMVWIFSYCRAHPSDDLANAAFQFINAMRTTKN